MKNLTIKEIIQVTNGKLISEEETRRNKRFFKGYKEYTKR